MSVTDEQALAALRRLIAQRPKPYPLQAWPVGASFPTPDGTGKVVDLDPTSDRTATIVTYSVDGLGYGAYVVEGSPWRFSRSLARLVPAGWSA